MCLLFNIFNISFIVHITTAADYKPYRIKLAAPLPASVEANTPFTIQLKMVNSDDNVITTSFNSGLEIMAQVAYTHKWFERIGGLWLVDTEAVLKGPDVVTSVINDKVIFTRFVGGYVSHYLFLFVLFLKSFFVIVILFSST